MQYIIDIIVVITTITTQYDNNQNTSPIPSKNFLAKIDSTSIWEDGALYLAKRLPIQSEGRVKPWNTYARFLLLRFSGRTFVRLNDGTKLTPIQWLLDCLFFPEISNKYPIFIVHDERVLESFGIKTHGKRRDRYSYEELIPIRNKLISQYLAIRNIHPQKRNYIQDQIITLAENILAYEEVIGYLEFTHKKVSVPSGSLLASYFSNPSSISFVELVETFPSIKRALKEKSETLSQEEAREELSVIRDILKQVNQLVNSAEHFAIIPPMGNVSDTWHSPVSEVIDIFDPEKDSELDIRILKTFTQLQKIRTDKEKFNSTFVELCNDLIKKSQTSREYNKIPLEVFYYDANLLFYSQWVFFFAVILTALWWLAINNKILRVSVNLTNLLGLALLAFAITLRCIIRERPPVTTLYETILFSTAIAVMLSLIVEMLYKEAISLSVASFLGLIGVFLANKYEMREGSDTMPALVAVLDTNFWLSAHVTTIVIGYGAGLVATALSHVWILGRLIGWRRSYPKFYENFSRSIYGVICFCFVFTLIGTVLGGIWAQYSWGRFWGWDPKENGALLIVLWCLVIIHARLGKFLSPDGIAWTSIILGIIVSFSWWGVNLLGVGLHSYGFTRGLWNSLLIFWSIEVLFTIVGIYISFSKPLHIALSDKP